MNWLNNMNNPKYFDECIIHIGTEKTGTSSLQKFFSINRHLFRSEGILYTKSAGNEAQPGFVALVDDHIWKNPLVLNDDYNDFDEYRISLLEKLKSEFKRNADCKTLLISSEHFHSRLKNKEQILRLKEILDPYINTFKVIVYFRRQDELAVSSYSTKVKSGATNPVLFPQLKEQKPVYYFNNFSIYKNWSCVFGDESMIVREFKKSKFIDKYLINDFCAAAGLNCKNKQSVKHINRSLSNKGIAYLTGVNKLMPIIKNGRVDQDRVALGQYIESQFSGKMSLASKKDAIEFCNIYKRDNDKLNKILVSKGQEALFSDDFTQYPETVEIYEATHEDVVAMSLEIWTLYLKTKKELDGLYKHRIKKLNSMRAKNLFLDYKKSIVKRLLSLFST